MAHRAEGLGQMTEAFDFVFGIVECGMGNAECGMRNGEWDERERGKKG